MGGGAVVEDQWQNDSRLTSRRSSSSSLLGEIMRHVLAILILVFSMSIGANPLCAETINIVAFGASNTLGMGWGRAPGGVPVAEAYPAKLERALRARGWYVSVSNQGVAGDTARDAIYSLDRRIPSGTKLTIVDLGIADRNSLGASPPEIASSLAEVIRRIRAKGSAIILVKQWPHREDAIFAAVQQSADAVVGWIYEYGLFWVPDLPEYASGNTAGDVIVTPARLRPEYDSGDHSHVNAAGTDVIVSRALPDMERVLTQIGFRPNR
jgi:acyl-CoA thioesterase I